MRCDVDNPSFAASRFHLRALGDGGRSTNIASEENCKRVSTHPRGSFQGSPDQLVPVVETCVPWLRLWFSSDSQASQYDEISLMSPLPAEEPTNGGFVALGQPRWMRTSDGSALGKSLRRLRLSLRSSRHFEMPLIILSVWFGARSNFHILLVIA